ncbi:MAG: cupin domain-containing protein [Firmicutes bacterium]|nr:cupin domain-containing protein [Bacillota bacterium]
MQKIIIKTMDLSEAKKLGIDSWSTWECEPSSFPWHYPEQETAYIYEGEVIVTVGNQQTHITAGMLVSFPQGMDCHWDVKKKIRKAYTFNYPID